MLRVFFCFLFIYSALLSPMTTTAQEVTDVQLIDVALAKIPNNSVIIPEDIPKKAFNKLLRKRKVALHGAPSILQIPEDSILFNILSVETNETIIITTNIVDSSGNEETLATTVTEEGGQFLITLSEITSPIVPGEATLVFLINGEPTEAAEIFVAESVFSNLPEEIFTSLEPTLDSVVTIRKAKKRNGKAQLFIAGTNFFKRRFTVNGTDVRAKSIQTKATIFPEDRFKRLKAMVVNGEEVIIARTMIRDTGLDESINATLSIATPFGITFIDFVVPECSGQCGE